MACCTDDSPDQITPANLREYRRAAGMTQEQLGDLIGLDKFAVCKIELGKRELNYAEQLVLSSYLLGRPLPQPRPQADEEE